MPVITVEAGKMSKEAKSKLVQELTASASAIMNASAQSIIIFM